MGNRTLIKVGKLYKTAFSKVKVDFRIYNPNKWHSDFKKHNPYAKTISPEDIFMVLDFEPLDQKSGKTLFGYHMDNFWLKLEGVQFSMSTSEYGDNQVDVEERDYDEEASEENEP